MPDVGSPRYRLELGTSAPVSATPHDDIDAHELATFKRRLRALSPDTYQERSIGELRLHWASLVRPLRASQSSAVGLYRECEREVPASPSRARKNMWFAISGRPREAAFADLPPPPFDAAIAETESVLNAECARIGSTGSRPSIAALRSKLAAVQSLDNAESDAALALSLELCIALADAASYLQAAHEMDRLRATWTLLPIAKSASAGADTNGARIAAARADMVRVGREVVRALEDVRSDALGRLWAYETLSWCLQGQDESAQVRQTRAARDAALHSAGVGASRSDPLAAPRATLLRLPANLAERAAGLALLADAAHDNDDGHKALKKLGFLLRAPRVREALAAQQAGSEVPAASGEAVGDLDAAVTEAFKQEIVGYESVLEQLLHSIRAQKAGDLDSHVVWLVGPPGIAKTKMVRVVANALDYHVIKIKGCELGPHDSTAGDKAVYVGSTPGPLAKGLLDNVAGKPVAIIVDELGAASPQAFEEIGALLDPEHNARIRDKFLDDLTTFDCSRAFVVVTCNPEDIDKIPARLISRLEKHKITLGPLSVWQKKELARKTWDSFRTTHPRLPHLTETARECLVGLSNEQGGARMLKRHLTSLRGAMEGLVNSLGVTPPHITPHHIYRHVARTWADVQRWPAGDGVLVRAHITVPESTLFGDARRSVVFEALARMWALTVCQSGISLGILVGKPMTGVHGVALLSPGDHVQRHVFMSRRREVYDEKKPALLWKWEASEPPVGPRDALAFEQLLDAEKLQMQLALGQCHSWRQSDVTRVLAQGLASPTPCARASEAE